MRYEFVPEDGNCPVCGCKRADRLYSVTAGEAAQHFVLRKAEPARHRDLACCIRDLWGRDDCRILRCRECGFGYAFPFVAGDRQFYALAYRRSGYPGDKWEFRQAEAAIARLRRDEPQRRFAVLEVGAGDGSFIGRICPRYVALEDVLCLEYSDYGVKEIRKRAIRAERLNLLDLARGDAGQYDLVCMFQVLEHMDRVQDVFETLTRLTKPRGHLFLAVPNPDRIEHNECNGALLDMPPNHIGRWNRNALDRLAARHGWSVVDFRTEPADQLAALKQFAIYRFLRQQQAETTLAAATAIVRNRHLRTALQSPLVALEAISALLTPSVRARLRLGDSIWAHLRSNQTA